MPATRLAATVLVFSFSIVLAMHHEEAINQPPTNGTGTAADPFVLSHGYTEDLQVGENTTVYYKTRTMGLNTFTSITWPCWGNLNTYYRVGGAPSATQNDGKFEWPSNEDLHHGKHIWEATAIDTSAAGDAGWLWIAVENTMPSTTAHQEAGMPVVSAFDLEVVGAGEAAFVPPDVDPVVSELTKTSFRLSWTASQEDNATYNVFFHKGHMGTGRMKPGYIMGSACGLEFLGKPAPGLSSGTADDGDDDVVADDGHSHRMALRSRALMDHTAHHVTRVNDVWSTALTAEIEGLQAGGEYHCDVFVRRPHPGNTGEDPHDTTHDPQNLPQGYDYRAYHSQIVLTPGSTDTGASATAAHLAAGAATIAALLAAALATSDLA